MRDHDRGCSIAPDVANGVSVCGMGLFGGSVFQLGVLGVCAGLFAGKPAPTGFVGFAVGVLSQNWLNA
ncbi:hypothetical protein ABFV45_25170, partial [Pseudomonas urmiensis]